MKWLQISVKNYNFPVKRKNIFHLDFTSVLRSFTFFYQKHPQAHDLMSIFCPYTLHNEPYKFLKLKAHIQQQTLGCSIENMLQIVHSQQCHVQYIKIKCDLPLKLLSLTNLRFLWVTDDMESSESAALPSCWEIRYTLISPPANLCHFAT